MYQLASRFCKCETIQDNRKSKVCNKTILKKDKSENLITAAKEMYKEKRFSYLHGSGQNVTKVVS